MTASVFAVTKGRYQLLGGKPTLKKVHVLCWRVDNLFVQRDLFVKLITCTVVVHDGGVERLNICWICFDDLVMNKTANVTNICLEFLLSNCVPRTIGVPRKKKKKNSHGGRICLAWRWHLLRESPFSNHPRVLYQPQTIFQNGAGRRMGCRREKNTLHN